MSEPDTSPESAAGAPRPTTARRLGVGVALVVLPVGAAYTAWHLKQAEDRSNEAQEKNFAYDDKAVRTIDPALVKYREVGRIETGMQAPKCIITTADGRVLVGGERMVRVLDAKGVPVTSFAISGTPECLAMATDGTIYVGMKDHVEVYSGSGQLKATWAAPGNLARLTSIAVSGQDVFVADAGRRVVVRYGLDGKVGTEIGRQDAAQAVPGLVAPSPHMDVATTPDGSVWVANPGRHQLELYSRDGELQRFWGKGGSAVEEFFGCCNPSNIALLSDGSIVTAEKGVARVKLYQPQGEFDCIVAGPNAFGDNREGLKLAADNAGRVMVLEPGTRAIRIFERGA